MTLLPKDDRIRIWNALFRQAWNEACNIAKTTGKIPKTLGFVLVYFYQIKNSHAFYFLPIALWPLRQEPIILSTSWLKRGVWTSGKQCQFSDYLLTLSGFCFRRLPE